MPQGSIGEELRALRAQRGGRPLVVGGGHEPVVTPPLTSRRRSTVDTLIDVGRGVAKGAGQTAFNLGNLVHKTPLLGDLTDILARIAGSEDTSPDAAFAQTPDVLEAKSGAERFGKGVEQVGEFLLPAGPARLATIKRLVSMIPNQTPANQMRILNKAAALLGRVGGEAGSAAGVSMVHGESNPEIEGGIAATAPLVGGAGRAGVQGLSSAMQTKAGRELLPYLAAVLGLNIAGGLTPAGVASSIGAFGIAKHGAQSFLKSPRAINLTKRALGRGLETGTRVGAGVIDVTRARRRRLDGRGAQ